MEKENNKKKQLLLTQVELDNNLNYLKLPFMAGNYDDFASRAANEQWGHVQYLTNLIEGESDQRRDRATQRRVRQAHLPVIKTMDQFKWTWPKKINRQQIQNFFRLKFIEDKANIIFLGGVGLGKTHLATALAYDACLKGYSVLFATAIDVINNLSAAQAAGNFHKEIRKYLKPSVLALDELGYLPIDKVGADLLFQVISHRYERGAMIITSNRAFKQWPEIFNNDSTLTSAILDRVLHHAETAVIEGKSYRMKDQLEV